MDWKVSAGEARFVEDGNGTAGFGRLGSERTGLLRSGMAGKDRIGVERHGRDRSGMERQARIGTDGQGVAWFGRAG